MALVRPIQAFYSDACSEHGTTLSPTDILEDTDPHVKARPFMFEPVVPTVRGTITNVEGAEVVEQATAAPGESRKAKRS